MGLVLGLSLLTGFGAVIAGFYLGREAYFLWTRFRRKPAAVFFGILCAAAIAYGCAALCLAVSVMEFGSFFDLFPENLI